MKEEKETKDIPQKTETKQKTNLFLNLSLVFLGLLVLYLGYSLVNRVIPAKEDPNLNNAPHAADYIQIEVLNGCGVAGVADKFTNYLRDNKFDVIQSGNYMSFDVDKSMVIDRIGNMANAEKAAKLLGIKKENIIQQINKNYFLDVTFVIGKDYNQLKPFNK